MINKQLLQTRFSRQAHSYEEYANVQKKMTHQLLALLSDAGFKNQPEFRILEIGCGTGYLTERLVQLFPQCQLTAVDLAPGMIEVAKERVKDKPVGFICADVEEMTLEDTYDLIVSNATFQWFNQMENTIRRLFEALKPDGMIHFSTFGSLTFHELHASFERAILRLDLPGNYSPGQSFISSDGLQDICKRSLKSLSYHMNQIERLEIENFATVRDFLTSIKKIGANNSNQEQDCKRPSVFREMIRIYDQDYRLNDRIQATYHCLYVSIKKKDHEKLQAPDEDMR